MGGNNQEMGGNNQEIEPHHKPAQLPGGTSTNAVDSNAYGELHTPICK